MAKIQYAIMSNGSYIKSYGTKGPKLTDDIDKAKLYTKRSFNNHTIMVSSRENYQMVEVKVSRSAATEPVPISILLEQKLVALQAEFDILNIEAEKDIEAMTEPDFRRWRRLRSVLKARNISFLDD
jgi:hypothetical protein